MFHEWTCWNGEGLLDSFWGPIILELFYHCFLVITWRSNHKKIQMLVMWRGLPSTYSSCHLLYIIVCFCQVSFQNPLSHYGFGSSLIIPVLTGQATLSLCLVWGRCCQEEQDHASLDHSGSRWHILVGELDIYFVGTISPLVHPPIRCLVSIIKNLSISPWMGKMNPFWG